MENQQIVKMLKEKLLDIENSNQDPNPDQKILTVQVSADIFLKMAYLFVGIHDK